MLYLLLETPECPSTATPCDAFSVLPCPQRPCLIRSASLALPNSHMFIMPCSLKSIFFIDTTSCAGGLLTRLATMTGSVSRMMPSSTISSMASETRS